MRKPTHEPDRFCFWFRRLKTERLGEGSAFRIGERCDTRVSHPRFQKFGVAQAGRLKVGQDRFQIPVTPLTCLAVTFDQVATESKFVRDPS